jgi:hypothetical protein
MSQSAIIELVEGSAVSSLTLDELMQYLGDYQDQLALTGKQLGWDYEEAGFPYAIETRPEAEGKWLYLKGKDYKYNSIVLGIGSRIVEGGERHYIQIVLPAGATHGDKNKANELCKHLGRKLKAELHLFNGRVMYFNPRK